MYGRRRGWERRLAQVSAGTLGFILGNLPGAYGGYRYGGRYYDLTHNVPHRGVRSRRGRRYGSFAGPIGSAPGRKTGSAPGRRTGSSPGIPGGSAPGIPTGSMPGKREPPVRTRPRPRSRGHVFPSGQMIHKWRKRRQHFLTFYGFKKAFKNY